MSISEPETPFLSPAEKLFKLYDGVQAFVMFIGYKRSCHSLVAALLDAHPEIVVSPGYQVIEKWEQYQSPELKEKRMQKYRLFYDLHQYSLEHAMFLKRASSERCLMEEFKYNYHIPSLWQGGFQHRIKVSYRPGVSYSYEHPNLFARPVGRTIIFLRGGKNFVGHESFFSPLGHA